MSLHIIGPKTHERKGLVTGPVEDHVVISHIEMAVVVDPLVFDFLDGTDEGGGEGHGGCSSGCGRLGKYPGFDINHRRSLRRLDYCRLWLP